MSKYKLIPTLIFIFFSFLYAEDLVYVIEKGDTLYGLSKKYNIPVSEILAKNNLKDGSKIKTGQKLIIPKQISKKNSETKENKDSYSNSYKIQKGDSLFGIAKKLGVNFSELLKLNNFTENTVIKIGQTIKIPVKGKSAKSEIKKSSHNLTQDFVKKANPKLLWPIPASEVLYLSGKIAGVTIDSKKNQTVKAIASGKVVSTGTHRGFGQVVFVQSRSKHIYVYGGLGKITVKKDDPVSVDTKIGELGSELFTGKARLYFMVYYKNKPIDPQKAPRGH